MRKNHTILIVVSFIIVIILASIGIIVMLAVEKRIPELDYDSDADSVTSDQGDDSFQILQRAHEDTEGDTDDTKTLTSIKDDDRDTEIYTSDGGIISRPLTRTLSKESKLAAALSKFPEVLSKVVQDEEYDVNLLEMQELSLPQDAQVLKYEEYLDAYKAYRAVIWGKLNQIQSLDRESGTEKQIIQLHKDIIHEQCKWRDLSFPLFSVSEYYSPSLLTPRRGILESTVKEYRQKFNASDLRVKKKTGEIFEQCRVLELSENNIEKIIADEIENFKMTVEMFRYKCFVTFGKHHLSKLSWVKEKLIPSDDEYEKSVILSDLNEPETELQPSYDIYVRNYLAYILETRLKGAKEMVNSCIEASAAYDEKFTNELKTLSKKERIERESTLQESIQFQRVMGNYFKMMQEEIKPYFARYNAICQEVNIDSSAQPEENATVNRRKKENEFVQLAVPLVLDFFSYYIRKQNEKTAIYFENNRDVSKTVDNDTLIFKNDLRAIGGFVLEDEVVATKRKCSIANYQLPPNHFKRRPSRWTSVKSSLSFKTSKDGKKK